MNLRSIGTSGSRKLAIIIALVMAPPAAALVWLGTELLSENRSFLKQQDDDRRNEAADAALRSLEASVAAAERALSNGRVPDGAARISISPAGVDVEPATHAVWTTMPVPLRAPETAQFDEVEALEYQRQESAALARYEELARSPVPAVRAGALLRIARVRRAQTRWDDALAAYRELAEIRGAGNSGAPVDLWARRQQCAVLEEAGRTQELRQESAGLAAQVLAGRWSLDRDTWELTTADLARWLASTGGAPETSHRMAVADTTVLLKTSTDGFAVVVVPPKILRDWVHEAQVSIDDAGESRSAHRLALFDERDGALVGDRPAPGSPRERRTPTDTGLPWTIVVSPENPSASGEALAVRRSLLAIAAVMVLMAGGSYVLWSLVRRDLEVARQQTEFVSAVSHEFRTPLTSVRHVTELLQENDALPADRRRAFYDALGRNGERLHRLVESLLDFARMEGKRKPYDLQPIDVRTFVSQVVSDFRRSTPEDAAAVELAVDEPGVGSILADEGALATALWNLLDNAVKYSDRPANVHIGIARRRRDVVIEVRDRGFGIPPGEQTAIFRKFFRGRQPTALRIKGTGIGLAMVSYIVAAHGGRVELESKEGVGSAFRIVLPARQGHIANDRTVPTAREATLARPEAMFPFTGNPSPESRVPSPESRVPSPESRRLKPGA